MGSALTDSELLRELVTASGVNVYVPVLQRAAGAAHRRGTGNGVARATTNSSKGLERQRVRL
ncbi:MAG: hypothetical protein F4Y14_22160 [Acidobacteria bacterium]|nr:hypothetical protein [Acidobacteriota bacterium]